MNQEQLQDALHQPYDREQWRGIVQDVFAHAAFYDPQEIPCDNDAVESFTQIGDVRLEDGKNLALFEIRVSEKVQLLRNRVALRNVVARHIDQATNHGVLVIFDSHADDYRFTFAARESEFDDEGNLVERETATRRYTYVLGPNETCRTAADRFHDLSLKRDTASLDDVQDAFSVERLNKEFFNAYKEHYTRFTDYLINSDYRRSVFGVGDIKDDKARAAAEKPIRDFAKRLLGRIVFLHFIQKKGWLGCPADHNDWVDGNPQFLKDLFESADAPERFHSACLVPLFHAALNTPDRPNDIFELTQTRIPYLNGGLFERDDPDVSGIDFPAAYFRDLLDFFGQYNFTIDENDPEDHEVGIDPEMLGHIFENLLEDNKDKGAYYTPKAIVQYMCQESLIQYLKTHLLESSSSFQLEKKQGQGQGRKQDACATVFFDPHGELDISRRNLPHWSQHGVTYFVTFRLADSLPADKVEQLRHDRELWAKEHTEPYSDEEKRDYARLFSERVETWLDTGAGSCVLRQPEIAGIVAGSLKHFDGDRYHLGEWVVMPNHVHALVTPLAGHELSDILHSWKSFMGTAINKHLGREGQLWQHESYDHIVRSEAQLSHFQRYIRENPEKAGIRVAQASCLQHPQAGSLSYTSDAAAAKAIENLVRLKSRGDEHAKDNFIVQNAPEIERLLDAVKVCDPAIGSGAFPIGILQEIYWIKLTLDLTLDRAEVKRGIIQNSIYGVDIDAGAVEIARLRFWLSLVVDEDTPSPLPNLDYKIMQGNSLLESFEGIPLGNLTEGEQVSVRVFGSNQDELNLGAVGDEFRVQVDEERRQSIIALMDRYFSETAPGEKARIHEEIDRFVLDHIDHNIAMHKERLEIELHQLHASIKAKQKQAKNYKATKKEERRLKQLEDEIAADDRRKERLHELEHKPERPFFLWHLFFQNVLDDGGFDIVIANPPYVRQEAIKEQKEALKRTYECYAGTADLFVYFYERSVKLLRDGGILTYITSNKYYRSAYGKKLRTFLAKNLKIAQMIDFGDAPVFDAIAYASIFIGRKVVQASSLKSKQDACATLRAYTWSPEDKLNEIRKVFRSRSFPVAQAELQPEAWRLESPEVMRLLQKLSRAGTPLGEYVDGRLYFGIKTGLNEAFVVDRATRDRLIAEDPRSEEVLVPFLRGRDVKRWRVDFAEHYLIKIESSENKKHPWSDAQDAEAVFKRTYPAIHKWMRPFRERLINRWDQGKYFWELRSCAYYEDFQAPKILYPDIYEHQSYCYDECGFFSVNTTYFIPTDEKWLAALLNSNAVEWFYGYLSNRVRGGYLRAFSDYVEQIPVPSTNAIQQEELASLVDCAQQTVGTALADIELQINEAVYQLFDLAPAEVRLVESSLSGEAPSDAKSDLRAVLIPQLKQLSPYFTIDNVRTLLEAKQIEIADSTLKRYMSDFMEQGVIHDAGRGWYSGIAERTTFDPEPVREVVDLLEEQFPLLDAACWSTQQVNPWMHHLLAKFVTVVQVDRDGIEAVSEVLRDADYQVYADPKAAQAQEVRPGERSVVVRPLKATAPREGRFAPPEAVLVDLLVETNALSLMSLAEFKGMAQRMATSSRLVMGTLLHYAGKRDISPDDLFADFGSLTERTA